MNGVYNIIVTRNLLMALLTQNNTFLANVYDEYLITQTTIELSISF